MSSGVVKTHIFNFYLPDKRTVHPEDVFASTSEHRMAHVPGVYALTT
jgi:hypothetical protein